MEGLHKEFSLHLNSLSHPSEHRTSIAIASTFIANPLQQPLSFWMRTVDISADVTFAPYAQVLQELLNPASTLARNETGFNVALIRLEDWFRDRVDVSDPERQIKHLRTVADEFVGALDILRARTRAATLVFICPVSSVLPAYCRQGIEEVEQEIFGRLKARPRIHCLRHAELARLYPVREREDLRSDRLGHIPYTTDYFTALGTFLTRYIAALVKPQYKVIAVDCDNTLWEGICGEEGASGVKLTSAHLALQDLLIRQHDLGVLLCLCSKNNEADVNAVFDSRTDMLLRPHHLIASRVNWLPKSENLQALAEELGLGLDSFIFIDDDPLECEEVRTHSPSVLTLQMPRDPAEVMHFVDHVWAFDRTEVTEEAKRRTEQYRMNQARTTARAHATSLEDFLVSLNLRVDLEPMRSNHLPRVAELIQRTNQFNFTSIRRKASEIETLWLSGHLEILVVNVQDRFGDYGLVGTVFFVRQATALEIDTLVLSCRVLGRGVEYRIVNELAQIARRSDSSYLKLKFRRTARNTPAREFLEEAFGSFQVSPEDCGISGLETVFCVPVEYAEGVRSTLPAEAKKQEVQNQKTTALAKSAAAPPWQALAYRLSRISDIVAEIRRATQYVQEPELRRSLQVAPGTPAETALAGIWADILGLKSIGVQEDFFEIGGDSVQAVQVVARIESNLGVELSLADFFETPTVRALAERLSAVSQSVRPISLGEQSGPPPLSWTQRSIWFIDQLESGSTHYHIPLVFRVGGELDTRALSAALNSLIARHECMRTAFVAVDGEPVLEVLEGGSITLRVIDLSSRDAEAREQEVSRVVQEELALPFDLGAGCLIRSCLLRLSGQEHLLMITLHHIVSDGWSIGVLSRELGILYEAHRDRKPDSLPALPVRYADYTRWQREWLQGDRLEGQLKYWTEHLRGAPELLELPTDRPRSEERSYRGATIGVSLGGDLTSALKEVARRSNLTLAMILHTAWTILLYRLSGQKDIVVGTPVSNRRRTEFEGLIGLFVNILAVRVTVDDDLKLTELLQRVKHIMESAYAHQDVPLEKVVEVLRPTRSLRHNPIFQVMFVLHNTPRSSIVLPGLTLVEEDTSVNTAQFDLLLSLRESSGGISGMLNYATDLFDRATIERWIECFKMVIGSIANNSELRIGMIPLISDFEHRQVTKMFNVTEAVSSRGKLIHHLFEEEVERAPDAIAVVCEGQSVSYAELNGRANQLARYLRYKGVGPDQLVALCVERSLEMVVGLLGVLKAGGAYVPVDPSYPIERLQYMLGDAAPRVLLTNRDVNERLRLAGASIIALDEDSERIREHEVENLETESLRLNSRNLAYVIYTSGSTGRPKGVMIEHSNVTRLFEATQQWFNFNGDDVWTLFHSVAFDFSVWELWGALLYGGRVIVVPVAAARSPQEFYRLICEQGVTVLNQTPSAFVQLAEAQAKNLQTSHSLRAVIFGGEALELRTLRGWVERNGTDRLKLVNMYGITETTVHVTYCPLTEKEIESERGSLIGSAIPDLQTYLLDGYGNPVPIGVVGEIYVGGEGVARGYLNRSELTAERFVADRFSSMPGARLYKTGDLGRWRRDGTIEHLGRNDHQVKIRGFRIEVGEIEVQLTRHRQVKEAVVLARDVSSERRLVAYVVPKESVGSGGALQAEVLRAHLKTVLPEYMVPSAFVVVEHLPLTPNGKLDRRALPDPELGAFARRQYEAPCGKIEEVLAKVWQMVLQVERVGRHDDFFDLGGHSLLVLRALSKIDESFNRVLHVSDFYRNPTLRELANQIQCDLVVDEFVSLSQEATLDHAIVGSPGELCVPAKTILLTGCTGFVGRFLLTQLLQDTDATIYCMVRARTSEVAAARVTTTLSKWDLWNDDYKGRIVSIPGDLTLPLLGIKPESYEVLCQDVDSIYHCATSMNHLETYAMAKRANVGGAIEVLRLAARHRPKSVNYVSTLSIFSPRTSDAYRFLNESSPIDQERHLSSNGYEASKWVAEKIFMDVAERGVPCNIFRLGLVGPDTRDGRYDELQREYRILKTCLLIGCGIKDYRFPMSLTPVDYVARALVYLANKHPIGSRIFHLSSTNANVGGIFERRNETAGTPLELKSFHEWIAEIKRLHCDGRVLPATPLIEFAFSMDERALDDLGRAHARLSFNCDRTHRELQDAGILIQELDDHYLNVFMESMYLRDSELRESTCGSQNGPDANIMTQALQGLGR